MSYGTDMFQAEVAKVSGNTYYLVLSPLPMDYEDGMTIRFVASGTSTGQLAIRIRGLKTLWLPSVPVLRPDRTATQAGDAVANQIVTVIYHVATQRFQLNSAPPTPAYTPPASYTSSGVAFPGSGAVATFAHGLGAMPKWVRAVAINTNAVAERGYAQNDELDVASIQSSGSTNQAFSVSADATNVYVAQLNTATVNVLPRTGGAFAGITEANWNLKVYASL